MTGVLKKIVLLGIVIVALAVGLFPRTVFTEDQATMRLARTIYAMAGQEDYATKLAIGSLVMNRVENKEYPNTLLGVLKEKHQFPSGTRCDAESLNAAHEILSGTRTLDEAYTCWQLAEREGDCSAERILRMGAYIFY